MESDGTVHSIAEYRKLARHALPMMIIDFYDSGPEAENTLRHNRVTLDARRLLSSAPVPRRRPAAARRRG
ncbi:hypothetical protein [Chelativorans xinjiangense]|uniref:hypothetical protein n=1 Tax=Chelativorans xinjiangense TaxID=2681485 RepID=UPI001357AD95|nr:hypothetical protein [Chelativorans xinjiangense]